MMAEAHASHAGAFEHIAGTVYQEATVATTDTLAALFPDEGKPVVNPFAAAMAIRSTMARGPRPETWDDLANRLGISSGRLRHATFCLGMVHRMHDVGEGALHEQLDRHREQMAAFNHKATIQAAREHHSKALDEHGFHLPQAGGSEVAYRFPSDHKAPTQPNAAAEALIREIERVKPISWDDLSVKLDCDLGNLMAFCKLLARDYSFDQLSMSSLYHYFENQAAKAAQAITTTSEKGSI
jgi:hypothetical protein